MWIENDPSFPVLLYTKGFNGVYKLKTSFMKVFKAAVIKAAVNDPYQQAVV